MGSVYSSSSGLSCFGEKGIARIRVSIIRSALETTDYTLVGVVFCDVRSFELVRYPSGLQMSVARLLRQLSPAVPGLAGETDGSYIEMCVPCFSHVNSRLSRNLVEDGATRGFPLLIIAVSFSPVERPAPTAK